MSPSARTAQRPAAVHLVSLGCARNDVDSEELAARLEDDGFRLVGEPTAADAVVVNTCGFVETAKKDSVDQLLAASDLRHDGRAPVVVAVGCLAERYGSELADALPEADAVLGFDDYPDIAARLRGVLAGERPAAHTPRDRRRLLPLAPAARQSAPTSPQPGHGTDSLTALAPASGPRSGRRRLADAPWAPLRLASGCDRRCSFCAIPSFRGSFLSRPPEEVLDEARWLADEGVREVFLVSENSTSYGKDLGDLRLLEKLLPRLAGVDGVERVRVSYLQPAEMRSSLVEVIATTAGVAPYFDLSFQHASAPVLRRMRRFGDQDAFLALVDSIRTLAPDAGIRSNVICGFPGESEADVEVLSDFLVAAELDAIGVFGYSDEDGTEAFGIDGKIGVEEVERRRAQLADLADELVGQRAEARRGSLVEVLVEDVGDEIIGRAAHQGPEVDGTTSLLADGEGSERRLVDSGDMISAVVVASDGVDLVVRAQSGGRHG